MFILKYLFFLLMLMLAGSLSAQDMKPFYPEGDAKYFDFWKGTWYLMKDDNSIDSNSFFVVRELVHPSCFMEEWHFEGNNAVALRTWDKINNRWGYAWVSANGLYQVWDTKKVNKHWYIYKQFTISGDTYLSRQSLIQQSDGTVFRLSEKSYDEKKWELRFRQRLKKVDNQALF